MKVIWAILCQGSVLDRDTNNISLFNVIEELQLVATPPVPQTAGASAPIVAPFSMDLVVLFTRSQEEVPEQGRGRFHTVGPSGQQSVPQEIEVDLTKALRNRTTLKLHSFTIIGEGVYRFIIEERKALSEFVTLFELPLRVSFDPTQR